jgi:hypothetical protein
VVERMSDADLRYIWFVAAWHELKGRQWRAAREAWRNACTERPPERWSTGVHIYGLDR